MKNTFRLLCLLFMMLPGLLFSQTANPAAGMDPVQHQEMVNPDRLLFFIVLGLFIAFILFIIFALSKATSALSNTLGERYKSGTQLTN
jgi:hypothetical protein